MESFTSTQKEAVVQQRVLLIVASFPKLSETFIVSKFLGLLKQGWDVHILCKESDPAEWAQFPELQQRTELRQRVHITWPHHPRGLAALLLPLAFLSSLTHSPVGTLRYLYRGWQRFGLDVVRRFYLDAELIGLKSGLLHFEFGTLAAKRMYLKALLNCRIVVSFRGYDLNYVELEKPNYYGEVWELADALHLLGEDLWQRAQRRGCPPYKPHALIPPGIDTEFFGHVWREHAKTTGRPERPLRILSVGRLEWKKGYEHALQAVKLLLEQGIQCEYHIVGEGKYLEPIAFARHQLGLERVVHLLGAHTRTEVKTQMLWADVLLHPSVSEGFCNAVIEAQAMAVPVVCTDADGLAENIADGETGFVVPRRDPQSLAQKLTLLAQNPALRQRMGEAGRQRVNTRFQLKDQVADFGCLYRQVLSLGSVGNENCRENDPSTQRSSLRVRHGQAR